MYTEVAYKSSGNNGNRKNGEYQMRVGGSPAPFVGYPCVARDEIERDSNSETSIYR